MLKQHQLLWDDTANKKRDIIYARVSSHDQKSHGDLDRQVRFLIDSVDGDRLTRFGFHYLETVFKEQGVEIVIVKQQREEHSVEQELVEDMMSLIASFSGKLYGLRSKKKQENHNG